MTSGFRNGVVMTHHSDPLDQAYQAFLNNQEESLLFQAIQSYGGKRPSPSIEYPICHRICDIQLLGKSYRVSRVFDAHHNSTQLFIYPLENGFDSESKGVPYELQGGALARWVWDESNHPTKDEQDWREYL